MKPRQQLAREINKRIDTLTARGDPLEVDWIARSVLECVEKKQPKERKAFVDYALKRLVREEVARALTGRPAAQVSEDAQLMLAGFEHLKPYYLVDRDGQRVAVPIDQIQVHEFADREATTRKRSATLQEIADDLKRLIEQIEIEKAKRDPPKKYSWQKRRDISG